MDDKQAIAELLEALEKIANAKTMEPIKWQQIAQQAINKHKQPEPQRERPQDDLNSPEERLNNMMNW